VSDVYLYDETTGKTPCGGLGDNSRTAPEWAPCDRRHGSGRSNIKERVRISWGTGVGREN